MKPENKAPKTEAYVWNGVTIRRSNTKTAFKPTDVSIPSAGARIGE